jgi:hypothetical protein
MSPSLDFTAVEAALHQLLEAVVSPNPVYGNVVGIIREPAGLLELLVPYPGARTIRATSIPENAQARLQELVNYCYHPGPSWFLDSRALAKELLRDCLEALRPAPETDGYVDLDQMAAVVNRSKSTLEKMKRRKINPLPDPDVPGGGGKKDEWLWASIRPWLETEFNKRFTETLPRRL